MPLARNPEKFLRNATSMIDISDGLYIDLYRICRGSKVGAKIYAKDIPISNELIQSAEYLNLSPFEMAAGGGEDYELLFTAPGNKNINAFCIGEITGSGMKIVDETGRTRRIPVKGYQHFAVLG